MKKLYRLKRKKDVEAIIKKKQSYGNKAYVIYINKNIETESYRVGISASKKLGNAVVRNKIKRQMRAVFRQFKNNVNKSDLFIIARPGFLTMSHKERTEQLKMLLKRSNVWVLEEK